MQRAPANAEVVPATVEELLAAARATLHRLTPGEARAAMLAGAQLVDIRSDSQRALDGTIPGAAFVPATSSSGAWTRLAHTMASGLRCATGC